MGSRFCFRFGSARERSDARAGTKARGERGASLRHHHDLRASAAFARRRTMTSRNLARAAQRAAFFPRSAARFFSSDSFSDKLGKKEAAEERLYFNKEDEKLLRGLLGKMKAQAECSDRSHKEKERSALIEIVGTYSLKNQDIERLIEWRHRSDF